MSIRSDITKSALWFRFETKTLTIPVLDADGVAVDLSGIDLLWKVIREQGSATIYLQKITGAGLSVSGADNNIVTITIDPDVDYDDLPAGIHYHELWDSENSYLLCHGDAHLQKSRGP